MEIIISNNRSELGQKAARKGADLIRKAILESGKADIIVATGSSQFEMLAALVKEDMEWPKVTAFHLDEYIGLPATHPASFRKDLKERFADEVPLRSFIYVNGDGDPVIECKRIGKIISEHQIDVAFIGIGENGHIAFNDPPADFETDDPYIIVNLDDACRHQQLGEGWFPTLNDVPRKAISMSVKQIMKSKAIICTVPDLRKAEAVKKTVEELVTPAVPATVLRVHEAAWLYLDNDSASLLS
ncbi:MAG: glucosamine-6-phosphate deaminase [Bacteroidales bacterium]|nr:glucosamine-6-phosphate deaminase [Bacteroidales bacterium]